MNWLEKAVAGSYSTWKKEGWPPYGYFHWIWILAVITSTIFSCWFFRKRSGKKPLRVYLIVYAVIIMLLEGWKQMGESYEMDGSDHYFWKYDWSFLPLQFCSTPMYVAFLAGVVCEGRFRKMLFAYLALFGLFGGFITYAVPMEVLSYTTYFSLIHTMVYHGFMIVVCTTLLVFHIDLQHKTFLYSLPVFAFFVVLAEILNLALYRVIEDDAPNLFFISPYFTTHLPIFVYFQRVHFSLFIIMYILLFPLAGYLVLLVRLFLGWVVQKITAKMRKHWPSRFKARHSKDVEEGNSEGSEQAERSESEGEKMEELRVQTKAESEPKAKAEVEIEEEESESLLSGEKVEERWTSGWNGEISDTAV